MPTELTVALKSLERRLMQIGDPIIAVWAAGLSEEVVTAKLNAISFRPSDSVLEWFAWHDGTDDGLLHRLGAIPVEPLTLDQALAEYAELRALALDVTASNAEDADRIWPATILPVAVLAGNGRLGLWDRRDPRQHGFAAFWPDTGLIETPTPTSDLVWLIQKWLALYDQGIYGVADGHPTRDWDAIPMQWRNGLT